MIDNDALIKTLKDRHRDESSYCNECEHTGRHFFIDKDGQVNHRYCKCYLAKLNSESYPKLLKKSCVPYMAWKFNFDDYVNTGANEEQKQRNSKTLETLKEDCKSISSNLKSGQNWFVEGQSGTGKTILACMLAKYAMAEGKPAAYVEFNVAADLMLRKIEQHEQDWLDYLKWCDVLVLDNVDGFTTTNRIQESIFERLVRSRVQNQRSMVYVSTSPLKHIHQKLGQSNAGMIADRCRRLTLLGADFRAGH